MKCRFFVLVVFATVVQYSPGVQPTTSDRIQTEMMLDYPTVEAFKKIAFTEYQKVINTIFNYLTDLANLTCRNQEPPRGSSFTANISKIELFISLFTQFQVTFLASLINNLETSTTIMTLQMTASGQIQNITDRIYDAIDVAQFTNSSGNLAEIEIFQNETITAFLGANAILYSLFENVENSPLKTEAVIARACEESNAQLRIVVENIFCVIKAGCESVFLVIESARNQAALAFETVVEITFGLIYKFLFALYVIQNGIGTDSSIIHMMEMAATSDYEMPPNSVPTMMPNGSTNVIPQYEDDMMAESAALDDAQKTARDSINTLVWLTYAPINITSANIADGNQCGFGDEDSITEIAARKQFVVSRSAIDSYFNSTILVEPNAIPAVNAIRNDTLCLVTKLIGGIRAAIELAATEDCSQILADFESIEETSISTAVIVTANIFVPIINAATYQPRTESVIRRIRDETLVLTEKAYRAIFNAIKILLAQACPEYRLEGDNCYTCIGDAQTDTISSYLQLVDNIFISIRILSTTSSYNEIEMVEDYCSCPYQ